MTQTKRILHLPVKGVYFNEMKSGIKTREYRLQTDYWKTRLEGRDYDLVRITLGYPSREDEERIMLFKWKGFERTTITHEHFGDKSVDVYAIVVEDKCELKTL
ncbi:MAG: ASCH domain-containing protein [Vibrio splendidus]